MKESIETEILFNILQTIKDYFFMKPRFVRRKKQRVNFYNVISLFVISRPLFLRERKKIDKGNTM